MAYHTSRMDRPLSYRELWEKYQDALETVQYYEEKIAELKDELNDYIEAYDEISNMFYG